MTRIRQFLATTALLVFVSLPAAAADKIAAKPNFADTAIEGLAAAMLDALPPDIQVTYDALHSDVRSRAFTVNGLRVAREAAGIASVGTLARLTVTGADIISALSGKPFTAERVALDRLDVIERPSGSPTAAPRTYRAREIVIEGARVASFVDLADAAGDPERVLNGISFKRATIDGFPVRDGTQALARLRGRK